MKPMDGWMDGWTNINSPFCIYLMHYMKRMHKTYISNAPVINENLKK